MRRHVHALLVFGLTSLVGCSVTTTSSTSIVGTSATSASALSGGRASADQRQRFLEMFGRGYYPGRSGQIFVVAREGEFITYHDPLYGFMHGSPWPYDTRIPMLFYGAPFASRGSFASPAIQQDVVPTLSAMLKTPPPSTITGHVLREALGTTSTRPKVVALMVFDAMRADYFDRYAELMPTISRLKREGAWFSNAAINFLPTVTSVGHATVGTGTDPRFHGQAANELFNRTTGKPQEAYENLDPRELMTLTLADMWNIATNGHAVIIGQGGAIRAVAGLVGHGACIVGGKPVVVASYSTSDGGWETNPECYRLPEYLKAITAKSYWEAAGGTWMGHDIASATRFRASSVFQRFEGDALLSVMDHEAIGADDVTDLILVNMKGPDYTAHAYGPDSAELKETLGELDRQMTKVVATLERKAGVGQFVIAITADHGTPAEPSTPSGRHYFDEVVNAIHQRFDRENKLVQYFDKPANSQIYIDSDRLRTLNLSMKDVAQFVESLGFIAAAYTEDEVRAASSAVPR